jgi:hypothetical protein
MKFPEIIAHMAAGGKISAAKLHFLDFLNNRQWVWEGFGPLTTYDGQEWQGVGDVVSTEGGGYQAGTIAGNLKVSVAARSDQLTDKIIQAAINSENEVYGRRYFQAVQYFDEAMQPVGQFILVFVGIMDRMSVRQSADTRSITLNVESPLVRRRTARVSYFSDVDQRRRDPTDRAFEFISTLANKSVSWPKY